MLADVDTVEERRTGSRAAGTAVAVATSDGITWTWDDLVDEFVPALVAYARSRGIREADDVVQDVLVTVVRRLGDFDGDSENLRSWLFTLAYRRIADQHRRFYRSPLLLVADHEPTPSVDDDAEAGLLESEAIEDAMSAFAILDDRQRDVLQLRIIEELSPRQVGAQLGLRSGHVRVIQSRALKRVRRHLDNRSRTRDELTAGVLAAPAMPALNLLRDLRTALPSDDVIGPWIDQVRLAATSAGPAGTASAVSTSASAASAVASAPAGTGSAIASAATSASQVAMAGGLATKIGAAGVGIVLGIGAGVAASVPGEPSTPVRPIVDQPIPADARNHGEQLSAGSVTDDSDPVGVTGISSLPASDRVTVVGTVSTTSTSRDDREGGPPPDDDATSAATTDEDTTSAATTDVNDLADVATEAADELPATPDAGPSPVLDTVSEATDPDSEVTDTADDTVDEVIVPADDTTAEASHSAAEATDTVDDTITELADTVDDPATDPTDAPGDTTSDPAEGSELPDADVGPPDQAVDDAPLLGDRD